MQEIVFLKQNEPRWRRFEKLLDDSTRADPDALAELFIELTDDLSYARTFYPGSETTRYLNELAARVHQQIYRNKKESRKRLRHFWVDELPRLLQRSHKELFYAAVVFALAVFIGVVSAANDDGFVRLILGDRYVNATLSNMDRGDPLAVYKSMNQVEMFLGITLNNIRVALFAFVTGVVFSFGTGFILFYNGVMLGAFHYLFYKNGLLADALLTVWIHGTLEISAIVVAGCAGLVIGNSILFPGTYSRSQSFRRGARQGLKIAIGLVPIFVVAGFLEGFVTRYTQMPAWLSLAIIGGSLVFVVWYFIFYPLQFYAKEEGRAKP
jgi:uncharacterized membrane protein SpoIIM required for sporulation